MHAVRRSLVHRQLHGYRNGHQILQSSVRLSTTDQDMIDQLSDIAGPLRPGERFDAYFTTYPLPSLAYYALARTEQDFDAPRAGCVITKTLLVPMEFWATEANPSALAVLLDAPVDDGPVECPMDLPARTIPPVRDPEIVTLVEALFLEERRAIVVFGAQHAEVAALRLLMSFWPNLRRTFSLCTYALSPRVVAGRSFDLLFAPRSVRSRFSDWDGRRIEAEARAAQHRWTPILTQRIFGDSVPHLVDTNGLDGLVAGDEEVDESTLRISLLWEELLQKTHRSPTAVLGLIDIANSRSVEESAWNILDVRVTASLVMVVRTSNIEDAWRFVTTLLGKLSSSPPRLRIDQSIRSAGRKLVQRDWYAAVTYLVADAPIGDVKYVDFLQVVAREVATSDTGSLSQALVALVPLRLIKIALLDEEMLSRVFAASVPDICSVLIQSLSEGWRLLTGEERTRHRRDFLRHICGDRHSGLLAQIVSNVETSVLLEAVNVIWEQSACRAPRVGEVLCGAAISNGSRREIRGAFAALNGDNLTNRCIERLLVLDRADIRWLLDCANIGDRRAHFIDQLIRGADSEALQRAFPFAEMAMDVVQLFSTDLSQYASSAARLILLPSVSAKDQIALGLRIYPVLQRAERAILSHAVVRRVLTDEETQSDHSPETVISAVINDLDISAVVATGLDKRRSGKQISHTLVAFDGASSVARSLIFEHALLIVRSVVQRAYFDLTFRGATALGRIIEATAEFDTKTHVEICSMILPLAMATSRTSASQIVVVTFPTVYDELRQGRGSLRIGNFFDFLDWDRCKVARKELVRAYLRSEWPPVDLAITALRSRDLYKILRRLTKEPRGRRYLVQIEESILRLGRRIREPIMKTIEEIREFQ